MDDSLGCIEAPLMGVQFAPYATDQGTPAANFGAAVDGNYGFGDGCFGTGGFDETTGACADGTESDHAARRTRLPGPGRDPQ